MLLAKTSDTSSKTLSKPQNVKAGNVGYQRSLTIMALSVQGCTVPGREEHSDLRLLTVWVTYGPITH